MYVFRFFSEILEMFVEESVAQRAVTNGKLIMADEVVNTMSDVLPDYIVEVDISTIQRFFTPVAWMLVEVAVTEKKAEWQCQLCTDVTTQRNMIACDKCDKWFHWCV
jgi:hypothetical protein